MYLEACHSVWNSLETQAYHQGGDTYCLAFLSESVVWMDDDYLLSVCWTNGCLCMLMVFVNVFLLIMVI